jgi:hypothetical protein
VSLIELEFVRIPQVRVCAHLVMWIIQRRVRTDLRVMRRSVCGERNLDHSRIDRQSLIEPDAQEAPEGA